MATRTVKVLGYSVGNAATISSTFNGTNVFSGAITTVKSTDPNVINELTDTLFTFPVDINTAGNISLSIQVTNGAIHVGEVLADYCGLNTVYTGTVNGFFYANLQNYNGPFPVPAANISFVSNNTGTSGSNVFFRPTTTSTVVGSTDVRTNITIDGVTVPVDRGTCASQGAWSYLVDAGQTFACTIEIAAGLETESNVPWAGNINAISSAFITH